MVDYEDQKKKQVDRMGEYKKHSEISKGQVIELGHILFVFLNSEVETIPLVEFEERVIPKGIDLRQK